MFAQNLRGFRSLRRLIDLLSTRIDQPHQRLTMMQSRASRNFGVMSAHVLATVLIP
jgi:hypothetical protein